MWMTHWVHSVFLWESVDDCYQVNQPWRREWSLIRRLLVPSFGGPFRELFGPFRTSAPPSTMVAPTWGPLASTRVKQRKSTTKAQQVQCWSPVCSQAPQGPWEEETRVKWAGVNELKKRVEKCKLIRWSRGNHSTPSFLWLLKKK